jgi:hypothetical protein
MINPKTQRFMAGRMGAKVRSSRVDHSPMYSAPDFAIDVILEAASVTHGDGSLPGRAATGLTGTTWQQATGLPPFRLPRFADRAARSCT